MPSTYPGSITPLPDPGAQLSTAPGHTVLHQSLDDDVTAIKNTLGVNPQGVGGSTVAARLATQATIGSNALDAAAAANLGVGAINAVLPGIIDIPWIVSTGVVSFGGSTAGVSSTLRYRTIATRQVQWSVTFTLSAAPGAGGFKITLPVSVVDNGSNVGQVVGHLIMLDSSLGARPIAHVHSVAATPNELVAASDNDAFGVGVSNTLPFVWAAGDSGVASGEFRSA